MSPKRLREHRDALVAFHNAYLAYLEATLGDEPASSAEQEQARQDVVERVPAAQAALEVAGAEPVRYPAPLIGGRVLRGLPNLVFAHEQPGHDLVEARELLDQVRLVGAMLEERERALRRLRRSPLYWGDRLLRGVLGFPAYLLSLILGVPLARIEESPWAVLLRLAELVVGAFGVYFAGRAAGWW